MAKIPGGITAENFVTIRGYLVQIRDQLNAKAVILRLNRTGETNPWPVFVGWVEDNVSAQKRVAGDNNEPDPGLFRFADTNPSKVYNETVAATVAGPGGPNPGPQSRNWAAPYTEKDDASKALVPTAGGTYQRYIGVKVAGRCAGTLSVAFQAQPADLSSIDGVLTSWATSSSSPLVTFLQNNFDLGGPNC